MTDARRAHGDHRASAGDVDGVPSADRSGDALEPHGKAVEIARGVTRLLMAYGTTVLSELSLPDGRRADIVGLAADGTITVVEIKSSVADFRSDQKWHAYRAYCDRFYFAVGTTFPKQILPQETGLILADRYSGAFEREAPVHPLSAARRKAMIIRFGRSAAARLCRLNDPALSIERF